MYILYRYIYIYIVWAAHDAASKRSGKAPLSPKHEPSSSAVAQARNARSSRLQQWTCHTETNPLRWVYIKKWFV